MWVENLRIAFGRSVTILSATHWPTNSELIADCARLGYIKGRVLDPTFGKGNWWKKYRPENLTTGDLYTRADVKLDFTCLPFPDFSFDTVAYDGPYKLNGTPTDYVDTRYGVGTYTRWQDRMTLLENGVRECVRVVAKKGFLLVKCMDQVVSGKVVFQTDMLTGQAWAWGLTKVDELLFMTNPREQPHERQVHSRRNYSVLMVFQRT